VIPADESRESTAKQMVLGPSRQKVSHAWWDATKLDQLTPQGLNVVC